MLFECWVMYARQLSIQKTNIKWRVMDDDLCIFDKGQKLLGNMFKKWFVLQKFIADAMYFDGVFMDIAVRVEVTMKSVA